MANCGWCEQEMTEGKACTLETYDDFSDKVARNRVPQDDDRACHDCKTPAGGLHHPGCDTEECPLCGGQAFACDCCSSD